MSSDIIPVARAGRRRFWVTVLCFALLNAAAWVVYDHCFAWRHQGTLRVDAFEPGEGATVGPHPTLRWHFSADVVPSSVYGKELATVTPALAGRWDWENPRTLVFTPTTDLPRATRISFALADTFLRTDTGGRLPQPFVSSVNSEPLDMTGVRQFGSGENDCYVIELHFNDRVAPGDVLQHLSLKRADGHRVNCRIHGQAADKVVRFLTDAVPPAPGETETSLLVELSNGLTGLSGPLGLSGSKSSTLSLGHWIAATDLQAHAPPRGQPFLLLRFNNDFDLPALKQVLSIEPALPFMLEENSDSVKLEGNFQPGTRYTVKIASPPAGSERAKYPRPGQLAAFIPDRGSGVWFDNDQGYLSTAGNRTLVAHAVNLDALEVSVTLMYDNNLVAWRNSSDRDRWAETDPYSRPLARKTIAIHNQKNVQNDVRLSLDDLLPAGTNRDGVFRIAVQPGKSHIEPVHEDDNDQNFDASASAVVTLSDIGLTAKQTRTGVVAWAASLRTAKPLAGVRIRLFTDKNQLLGEATTNTDGLATIAGPHPAKEESTAVVLADYPLTPAALPLGPNVLPATNPAEIDAAPPISAGPTTQLTWLDLRRSGWELGDSDISGRPYLRTAHEAFIYCERGVYRPGETAHLRALVRGPDGLAPKTAFPVRWQLRRPDLRDWQSQVVMLDTDGAAVLDIPLPADLPTGQWTASLGLPGESGASAKFFGSATFQIEEFIPNRLKVALTLSEKNDQKAAGNEPERQRFSIGDNTLSADVQGDYLFGRPAAGLALETSTRADPEAFRPAGWSDWTFGDMGGVVSNTAQNSSAAKHSRHRVENQSPAPVEVAVLNEAGRYSWDIDVAAAVGLSEDGEAKPEQYRGPWRLTTSAGVRETGGRAVTATRQMDVDLLPAYIGIRRDAQSEIRPGQPVPWTIGLVKPDGAPDAENQSTLQATLFHQSWNTVLTYHDGRYHYDTTRVLDVVQKAEVKLSDGRASWSPTPPSNGAYVVCFKDAQTGACSSLNFDATDGSPWDDNVSRANPDRLSVRLLSASETPDSSAGTDAVPAGPHAPLFRIGDTASVLVASPFTGRLLLTVETDDVVQSIVMDMKASHVIVPIHVTRECGPNAFVTATVIRPIDPNATWRTHRAFGVTRLALDPAERALNIAIVAPEQLRPLQSLDVGLTVTDHAGKPVRNAALTVAAVDEGICTLTGFTTPDPLAFFTAKRALSVNSADLYGLLMPEVARIENTSAVGGDGDGAVTARHHSPVVARRVKPVALAWDEVHTDANGLARASFSLPQFQGRLRVMAVGYAGADFGSNDRGVTVRSPIMAQTSWPRFAAPGDRFTVPIVLFNNTNTGGDAIISVSLQEQPNTPAGLMSFGTRGQKQLELPAVKIGPSGQRAAELPVIIGPAVGVAKVHLTVTMNQERYDEDLELPVRPAAPNMQYGGYAAVSTTQPACFTKPAVVLAGTESFRVSVTPWPILQLPQGLDYLDRYPYGCVEQTISTCFPLLALGDIGKQIDPVRFDPQRLKLKIDAGIFHLMGMQTADGGFSMWPGERDPWPWASVYAAHFLVEARGAGYDVPDDLYLHLLGYVRHLMDAGTDQADQLETQAYAGFVLALAGKTDRSLLNRLTELASAQGRPDDPSDGYAMRSDARLMLSCAWLLAGRRDLAEGLIPQQLPVPRTNRQSGGNIGSAIRDRALLIQTLVMVQPNNPALPDLVQRLADCGLHGQWASTQDTAFSVMAISRYLREEKKRSPYESAQLRLGDQLLAEATGGAPIAWQADVSNVFATTLFPATQPAASPAFFVKATGSPDAAAYVSWLQTGVPLTAPPDAQHGIKLSRRYLSLNGQELQNTLRSGDLVRVEVIIEAQPGTANIVIEDLLPAGLEAENPRLQTSAKVASADENGLWPFGNGRLDVRDDRVIIVGKMPSGKAHCTYLARAVTPGVYTSPPIRAEAMYDINTNAVWGAGKTLTVLPATANIASVSE